MSDAAPSFSVVDVVDCRRFAGYPTPGNAPTLLDVVLNALAVLSGAEIAMVQAFLAQLRTLELAVPATGATLNVEQAAVFTRNPRELAERDDLFRTWRVRMCFAIGIAPGPFLDLLVPAAFVV